jgi:pilus assembly protein Flp/PilA
MSFLTKLFEDRKGVTALEYGLIAALIAVAIITALGLLGGNLGDAFNNIAERIGNATATP